MFVAESMHERHKTKLARVLLVEDEPIIRLDLASELRGAHYEVIEASNAGEALSVLDSQAIDLMISDVVMPGSMDGVALAEHARAVNPDMKIIIVSGYSSGPPANVADEFFAKPYGSTPVLKTCRQLLDKREVR
jgi:two-component system, response regulator PdtaR